MAVFQIQARDASPKGYGRLVTITIRLVMRDCTGEVYFTDIQLLATGWVSHDSEIQC
jgi:hypothetical protein